MMKKQNPQSLTEKSEQSKKTKQHRASESSSGNKYAQDLINIEDICNGLVFTSTGSIVKILELLPINFREKDAITKDSIATTFGFGLKQGPKNGHIKIMHTSADITPFIQNVTEATKYEKDEKIKERVKDYIQNTISQKNLSTKNRFFYIFEYEGDEKGRKTDDFATIYSQIMKTSASITNAFVSCGNYVIDYSLLPDGDLKIAELLYCFYNPKSCKEESFQNRIDKIREGTNYITKKEKVTDYHPYIKEFITPRGIKFCRWDYMIIDGLYQTFFPLKDEAFPNSLYAGSLCSFLMSSLDDCDLDIYYKEQNRDATIYMLDRTNVISRGVARNLEGDASKIDKLSSTASNAQYIQNLLANNDEDAYNVFLFLTVRAKSKRELRTIVETYQKQKKAQSFYFDSCFMHTQSFWKMSAPLMDLDNQIFKDNSRNMTNSSIAALYCFSAIDMFSPTAPCMGIDVDNGSLISIDPFDTKRVTNPHISLIGTTGAGKTFTELMLTSRLRMHGIRVIYILPIKGHEYKECVKSLGGEFITLRAGSKTCINVMEIRPEAVKLNEDGEQEYSLRAQKIASIRTWFTLLLNGSYLSPEETGEMDALLAKLYESFGITDDNDSIWEDKKRGIVKTMPILSDLYEAMVNNPLLNRRSSILKAWTVGNCSNMNGHTNVDLSNKCIAFDVNEKYIGKDLLPAFMYIAFDVGYDICRSNELEKCALALDEVWKMLANKDCASQVEEMVRILRGYATSVITATQDIDECLSSTSGKVILLNSAIKIYLKVTKDEIKVLTENSVDFSDENKAKLINAKRGYGYICFDSEKIFTNFRASQNEVYLYTTDVEVKKQLADAKKHNSLL